jgi:Zn-dependent protease
VNWVDALVQFWVLLVSLTVHEAMHAWAAMRGGDLTAYRTGQVTLNPLPHIRREPFGMVALPLISLYLSGGRSCIGFAHAPYDPVWAARFPRRAALMSAAGPIGNLLLAAIAFAVLWFVGLPYRGAEPTAVQHIAFVFLALNLLLAVFNLIPLPPLDGAGIVRGLVPASRPLFDAIEQIPYFGLVVFLLASRYLNDLVWPLLTAVLSLLPH